MELATVKALDIRAGSTVSKDLSVQPNEQVKGTKAKLDEGGFGADKDNKKNDIQKEELHIMTAQMNKFLELLNADLRFAVHERTKTLMVQVVSTKDNRVLKEFPPKEFLDTIANIRDYVGFLLDEKA